MDSPQCRKPTPVVCAENKQINRWNEIFSKNNEEYFLQIFSKKYSFIKLRKIHNSLKSFDLEHDMTLNSSNKLNSSNLCFLIGLNTRYEGSYFNTKLRQRYLKGNFKIISVNSFLDLTIRKKRGLSQVRKGGSLGMLSLAR